MEVFVLHILKLNIIAAIVILLVKLLARPLKNKVSARWKYFIWMFVVLSLLIPIRLPAAVSIVNFKVQQSVTESGGQRKVQTTEFSDTAQPVNENIQNLAGVSIQKPSAIHENGKWTGIAAGIFLTVWVIVAILKMAGEFVAYYLSVKNLERENAIAEAKAAKEAEKLALQAAQAEDLTEEELAAKIKQDRKSVV